MAFLKFIKRIQNFTCTFSGGSTADTTITAVVTANCLIIVNGKSLGTSGGTFTDLAFANVSLTSTTNVRATAVGAPNSGGTVQGQIIEFYPGVVKSSGASTIAITNGNDTADATIGAVDLTKTLLQCTGGYFSGSNLVLGGNLGDNTETQCMFDLFFQASNTIRAHWVWNTNNSTPTSRVVGYSYVELRY